MAIDPLRVGDGVRWARERIGAQLDVVPLRAKLTLAFAGVMVVLFGLIALFLYLRFEAGLDAGIRGSLQARSADLVGVVRQTGFSQQVVHPPLTESGGGFAQILDARGNVLDSTPGLVRHRLLSAAEVRRALHQQVLIDRPKNARLLARPVGYPSRTVVVVGVSLTQRESAMRTLGELLFIGGPLALAVACAAGYALAASALVPVDKMRRRAARISGENPSERLPVPQARDELQRLGETLNEMLSRLQDAVVRERAFVADASHELRTPLSILKLELELALADGRSREDLEVALRSATEEVDRLTRLTQDLLFIARADQRRLPLQIERVEVAEVMRAVADRFAGPGRAVGRELKLESADGLTLDADNGRLQQALTNMVDNALRHGDGPVVLRAAKRGTSIELHVFDEGEGFPPDFLPRAFDRFSRACPGRSSAGTGLGLAIVRAVAVAHGGSARVENRADGGAHVWLSLPPAAGPAPSPVAEGQLT
jgi:heavy metal sensor kinase